jgi:putative ABC transport system permease protein
MRSLLTLSGIAWGIVAVVLLMAYGNGFHTALETGMRRAFNSGTILIYNGQTSLQAGGERAGRRIRLRESDIPPLRELGTVRAISPEYVRTLSLGYGSGQTNALVRGVAPEYEFMRSQTIEHGRFLNDEDVATQRRVVFLGSDVAHKLFGNRPAVGERIRLRGIPFEVIGVMTPKMALSNYYSPDRKSVFIPYSTVQHLWHQEFVDNLVIQTLSPAVHDQAIRQIRATLAERHHFMAEDERAIEVEDSVESLQMIGAITGGLQLILTIIGAMTLMIGGIGVMNMMLVSVTERTREIGVRKALGAKRGSILLQILFEALTITLGGGAIGLLFSQAIVSGVGRLPFMAQILDDPTGLTDIHLILSGQVAGIAITILVLVGLISGLWPAWQAARTNPIESLRYD